jgi:hypothetical protein
MLQGYQGRIMTLALVSKYKYTLLRGIFIGHIN